MKYLFLVIALSGCGYLDQADAHLYVTKCIDGVNYLIFPQSASVKYLPDGKIEACK